MKKLPPSQSFVEMTELVLTSHLNQFGTAFGGVIMSWVDVAGSISASRHCSKNAVTANIDDVHFLAPVHKGDIVNLKAQVNYTHKTSMEVGVTVTAENPKLRQLRHTLTAYLTFVALDEKGRPSPVPGLLLKTEEEKRRYQQGQLRRQWRLKRRKELS